MGPTYMDAGEELTMRSLSDLLVPNDRDPYPTSSRPPSTTMGLPPDGCPGQLVTIVFQNLFSVWVDYAKLRESKVRFWVKAALFLGDFFGLNLKSKIKLRIWVCGYTLLAEIIF